MATTNLGSRPIGSAPRITGTFKQNAVLTDPTTVQFTLTAPSGTTLNYTYGTDAALVKSSTGVYYVAANLNEAYTWEGKWFVPSSATGTCSQPFTIYVEPYP